MRAITQLHQLPVGIQQGGPAWRPLACPRRCRPCIRSADCQAPNSKEVRSMPGEERYAASRKQSSQTPLRPSTHTDKALAAHYSGESQTLAQAPDHRAQSCSRPPHWYSARWPAPPACPRCISNCAAATRIVSRPAQHRPVRAAPAPGSLCRSVSHLAGAATTGWAGRHLRRQIPIDHCRRRRRHDRLSRTSTVSGTGGLTRWATASATGSCLGLRALRWPPATAGHAPHAACRWHRSGCNRSSSSLSAAPAFAPGAPHGLSKA